MAEIRFASLRASSASLDRLMNCLDDRLQLKPTEELDFIEEQDESSAVVRCSLSYRSQDIGEVEGQISVVGEALGWFNVQRNSWSSRG